MIAQRDLVYFKDEGPKEPFLILSREEGKLTLGLRDYPGTMMDFTTDETIVNYYTDENESIKALEIIKNKL